MLSGRDLNTVFVILSRAGAFFLASLFSFSRTLPGVVKYIGTHWWFGL